MRQYGPNAWRVMRMEIGTGMKKCRTAYAMKANGQYQLAMNSIMLDVQAAKFAKTGKKLWSKDHAQFKH